MVVISLPSPAYSLNSISNACSVASNTDDPLFIVTSWFIIDEPVFTIRFTFISPSASNGSVVEER